MENNVWHWQGKPIEETAIPTGSVGFIYRITHWPSGRFYIGKKQLSSKRRSKIGVREKASTKTRKTYKTTVKDSGWMLYWGSCQELLEHVKKEGQWSFNKEIIEWCHSKKYMSYAEVVHQIKGDVLNDEINSYNGNIMNRWFKKDMKPIKDTQ